MNTRRALLVALGGIFAVARSTPGGAQSFPPPKAADLLTTLGNPNRLERTLVGVAALRQLLLLEVSRGREIDLKRWREDTPSFSEYLNQLRNADLRKNISVRLNDPKQQTVFDEITRSVLPRVKKIEDALRAGGLQPGSPLAVDLLDSFIQINLFLVATSPKNDSWYCRIYPLDVFC